MAARVRRPRRGGHGADARASTAGDPDASAEFDDDWQTLWFASRRDSGKVEELRSEPEVCLAYAGGQSEGWVSLTGVARVVDDRAKVNELYRSQWDNWFDGADDPNLVLIAVLPHTGEYWDAGSRLMVMAKLATAAVTGKRFDVGENQAVSM